MDDKIVTFETYSDPMLAEIILGRLKASGIDCYIADGLNIGVNPLLGVALGGIKLRVFERDVEKCRLILAQPEELELVDEPYEDNQTLCPYCHSANVRYGSATLRKVNVFSALIGFLFFTYPPFARKAWHCFNCSRDFNAPNKLY
jgi:hypothetical protein